MITKVTGTVTPSIPSATNVVTLLFTDTTTGVGTLVSRILNIADVNGNVIATINMGSSLTATFQILSDAYYSFTETITDNTGTYTGTINNVYTAFYDYIYSQVIAQLGCSCDCGSEDIRYYDIAQMYKNAAIADALTGSGIAAQNNITMANNLISGS